MSLLLALSSPLDIVSLFLLFFKPFGKMGSGISLPFCISLMTNTAEHLLLCLHLGLSFNEMSVYIFCPFNIFYEFWEFCISDEYKPFVIYVTANIFSQCLACCFLFLCFFLFWIMSCIVEVLKFDGVQFINFLMFFMPYLRTLTIPRSQRYLSTRTECSLTPEKSTQWGE